MKHIGFAAQSCLSSRIAAGAEWCRFDEHVIDITIERCAGMEPMKARQTKKVLKFSNVLFGEAERTS
jgi:hypothetical protein